MHLRGCFLTESSPNRRNWMDWSRVLCLYLVVFGHSSLDDSAINTVLSAFRMPLFFLFSGYNRKPGRTMRQQLRKDVRGLLLPYLGFWVLLYPFWLFAVAPRHPELYDLSGFHGVMSKPLVGLLLGLGYDTPWSTAVSGPLWFLVALFSVRTFHGLATHLLGPGAIRLALFAGAVAIISLRIPQGIPLPLSLASALIAYPFYVAGVLAREGRFSGLIAHARRHPLGLSLVLFTLLIPLATLNGRTMIACLDLGRSAALFYPAAFLGCGAFVALGLSLNHRSHSLLVFVSQNSLSVMALHSLFIAFGKIVLIPLIVDDPADYGVGGAVLLSAFALVSCIPFVLVLDRYAPWLTGRRRPPPTADASPPSARLLLRQPASIPGD